MSAADNNNTSNWFYIKHLNTSKVIAACSSSNTPQTKKYVRSQVLVIDQQYQDNELWCWDNNYLKNKLTGLVLDIRKGRLRLIEDTEICLYYKKPYEISENQLWAVRPASNTQSTTATEHPLFKGPTKHYSNAMAIYSVCNSDWVLDICLPDEHATDKQYKVVLFPQPENTTQTQQWEIIPEHYSTEVDSLSAEPDLIFDNNMIDGAPDESHTGYSSMSSSISCESIGYAHGLSPAKRSSQSSITSISRKESLEDVYLYQAQHFPTAYYQ